MIDIHSHILPNLDDGSTSLEESVRMLDIAEKTGTTDIVASPHSNSEFPFCPKLMQERLTRLRELIGTRIRIHSGCDFHLSYENIQDALSHPAKYTINNKSYLLVEFSDTAILHRPAAVFDQLMSSGITPIITHPERNALLQDRLNDLQTWVQDGCMVQVTAQSFLGSFGRSAKRCADTLLRRNLIHFIASDAHDCEHRPPRLDEAYAYVCRKKSRERAQRLFEEYPQRVLDGDPIFQDEYVEPQRKRFKFW
jgi:protein-tyrosine phosphatase